jgi:hypothetical protein
MMMIYTTTVYPTETALDENNVTAGFVSSRVGGVEKHQFGLWLAGLLLQPGG